MEGQKLVAAECLSRLNDNFYGQWLMLHVPFKRPEDFFEPMQALGLLHKFCEYFRESIVLGPNISLPKTFLKIVIIQRQL